MVHTPNISAFTILSETGFYNFLIKLKMKESTTIYLSFQASLSWGVTGAAVQVGAFEHLDLLQQSMDALLGCQGETN